VRKVIIVFAVVMLFSTVASALMPPHISSSVPKDGGVLNGNTVLIEGYSLKYAPLKDLVVMDMDTNEKIDADTDLKCSWIDNCGEKDEVGCEQQKCELKVTIKKVISGHKYKLILGEDTIEFTAAKRSK
jgi:hypothetical protein